MGDFIPAVGRLAKISEFTGSHKSENGSVNSGEVVSRISPPDVQKTLKRRGLEVIDIPGRHRGLFSVRNTYDL